MTSAQLLGPACEGRKPLKPCFEIRDRKTCLTSIDTRNFYKGPCGWCFGKNCPDTDNLCEPKKWFQGKGLKEGVDYEECYKGCMERKENPIPCYKIRERKTCLTSNDPRTFY